MTNQVFNRNVKFEDLHAEFLNGIFDSFGLPDRAMKELDAILTTTTKSLVKLTSDGETSFSSMDHMIFVTYFEKMEGINFNIPKLRLFFLHIDQTSWMNVVHNKKSSDETAMINFDMNYTDATFSMTWMPKPDEFEKLQHMLEKASNKSFKDLVAYNNTRVIMK